MNRKFPQRFAAETQGERYERSQCKQSDWEENTCRKHFIVDARMIEIVSDQYLSACIKLRCKLSFADLSRCQRTLAKSLDQFNFECIGSTQTDDEQVIADSLKQFGKLITAIEDERDNMVNGHEGDDDERLD